MLCHAWWAHRRTAAIFAVRMESGRVLGVCGPLDLDRLNDPDLLRFEYDPDSEEAHLARKHPEEFVLAEPFLRGHPVPVAIQAARGVVECEEEAASDLPPSNEGQRAA